jgi:hypothetical protein
VRIGLALAVMLPPAFLMGFAFPLGMDWVQGQKDGRAAWYWAINGALSVIATVIAMVTSFCWGIRTTFWIGIGLYLAAGFLSWRVRMGPAIAGPRARPASASRPRIDNSTV